MSFKKIVPIQGSITTFTLEDDVAVITKANRSGPWASIEFDMLMTTAEREEILNSLASPYFMAHGEFFSTLGSKIQNDSFTSESYEFMKYLIRFGIPDEIAAQTAFLTDTTGAATFAERKKSLEEFRSLRHSVKLVQTGAFTGVITFLPYYLIAEWGGVKLASRASRKVGDDPEALLKLLSGIMRFRGGKVEDSVSEVEFNVLMDFMEESYPATDWENEAKSLATFVMELVLSDVDWASASRFLAADARYSQDVLDSQLVGLLLSTTTTRYSRNVSNYSAPKSINTVVAILKSKFGVQALGDAFKVLTANSSILAPLNSHHFIAYVAIADYLSSGGSAEDSIGWMVSMEPLLDQERFFNRILINPA